MKTKQKNSRRFHLQKTTHRWKWMAGATAASAAGVTASQANTITVTLSNNFISPFGGNLNADLTGDGHPDLTIANAGYLGEAARATLNGVQAYLWVYYGFGEPYPDASGGIRLGSRAARWSRTHYGHLFGTLSLTGSIPIFFKDLHINGGAPTSGSLQVTVIGGEIQLDSFTYNSNTAIQGSTRTVPDNGSSLALLAMGAGGILALRRRRAAQQNS
jgi:hypothetical protein